MGAPRKYLTFTWRGKTMRRKIPSAAATRARVRKMIATKAAKAAERDRRRPLAPGARLARREALEAFSLATTVPHPRKKTNGNGAAHHREPDIEGAVICLTRAENWMTAAKHMGLIREFDPAHREIVAALGALLGLSAP